MDRDEQAYWSLEFLSDAMSCIGQPPDSVIVATRTTVNNTYTYYLDSDGVLWYSSARTDAFDAEIKEAARRQKAEKRKTSDATSREASEEPVIQNTLTDHYTKSIA